MPVTHYPTPGLSTQVAAPLAAPVRCVYLATNGGVYTVIGPNVYYITASWTLQLLGTIAQQSTPCYMADNGLAIVLVDGTASGYAIDMATRAFGSITSTVDAFYGATTVCYLDTYFIFNRPGTNQFYISLSNASYSMLTSGTAFDALDIAAKTGSADPIMFITVMHKEIWLIGSLTTEIWYNSGAADFTFQQLAGAYIEHGTVAPYSVVTQDLSVYWISQDRQGQRMVMRGANYLAERVSTHAVENSLSKYPTVADAVSYCYQQKGHIFYMTSFPAANDTWCWDEASSDWHQRAWTDAQGNLNRHRSNVGAPVYGKTLVGDWENGTLYSMSPDVFTDAGTPISRIRAFPHSIADMSRISYRQFIADMAPGDDDGSLDGSSAASPPMVSLRWSDDRGATWGNYIETSLGASGQYSVTLTWRRLGLARDRVFELSWSSPAKTALNGAYVDTIVAAS
jgi:hypothetical protein